MDLRIVIFAPSHRAEAQLLVQADGRPVALPDLQGEKGQVGPAKPDKGGQDGLRHPLPPPGIGHRDLLQASLVQHHAQLAVAQDRTVLPFGHHQGDRIVKQLLSKDLL